MADIITETNTLEPQAATAGDELAQQMAIALNGGIQPQQQPAEQVIPAAEVVVADTPVLTFESIKDKFGYQSPEDAIKEIESLRGFKENPSIEIPFENEVSQKLFDAIKAGKQKEVYAILAEQERLEAVTSVEINKDNAGDIIKLGMQLKYKDLSPSEIDYKFKKQFSLPKTPVQSLDESDEDFEERKSQWKDQVADIEMDKILEAKLLKPELEAHKAKLVLPEIDKDVDEDYESWKAAQEKAQEINTKTIEAYKAFTPKTIETKVAFNDEANKINFEFQYEPAAEDFKKAVDIVSDFNNEFFKLFTNQDGTPDRKGFLRAINFAVNPDKVIMEAIKQSKNATLKSQLPDNSGGQRQIAQTQEVSELDANMRMALNGYGRN